MNAMRQKIAKEALSWCGTPYMHAMSCKKHGTDCLGLVRGLYVFLHKKQPCALPAYSPDWRCTDDILLESLRHHLHEKPLNGHLPGDVLVFRLFRKGYARHLGIATTERHFVHAYARRCVREECLGAAWKHRLCGVFSFV